jgi:hypothetical protein
MANEATPRRWGCAGVALAVLALPFVAYGFVQYRISNPEYAPQPLPDDLVAADGGTGRLLLANAEAKADHAPLTRWFVPQQKLSWCGVASATIVLNALDVKPPSGDSWQQHALFTRGARRVKSRLAVTFGGMTLAELEGILDANGALADAYRADENPLDRFRAMAEGNLGSPLDFLIVNYARPSLGQAGGGHISPVAAWDRDTDRFLVLDTAAYKYPWTWVRGADLHAAMNTIDPDSQESRGWVVVRRAR